MKYKLLRGEEPNLLTFNNNQQLAINQRRLENFEFCFQFDDDEPVPFGTGENDLHIHITPTENGHITFNNNGKVFKILAREIV